MNNIISETTRPNGIKVQLEDSQDNFIVKVFYSDGSRRNCEFFGMFSSAVSFYNRIVTEENAKGEAK